MSVKNKYEYVFGIDPGVKTGVACWDVENQVFDFIETTDILNAISLVKKYHLSFKIFVRIENPNLRKWFGNSGREVLQGAGSIKRDYSIWDKFLVDNKIPFDGFAPMTVKTKVSVEYFRKITGYKNKTSVHARDAAMSVFMYK